MAKSAKNEKSLQKYIPLIIIIIVAIVYLVSKNVGDDKAFNPKPVNPNSENMLIVHYLDVGQGDCEFIELPDGRCLLIDAGESDYSDTVIKTIRDLGYDKIDCIIGTHPHSDHIGGLKNVIDSFDVGEIYMPRASNDTYSFEKLLRKISEKGLKITAAEAGKTVLESDEYTMKLLAPNSTYYEDLNNYSAVLKLEYNGFSFLFTGDAERLSESEMLENFGDELDCDVLKVGHHGSRYSSSAEFLSAVSPSYAIISCAKDNSYGHPHEEALNRLYGVGAQVLRTDQLGSITVCCDGEGGFDVAYEMDS